MHRIKTVIMGAAGRDFHNFNTVYRDNEAYDVVAFTATQIPNIDGRKYPASLAGRLYPKGIPIVAEFSTIFSSTSARSAARAIAQASGLPPKVLPWSPGLNTPRISFDDRTADTG